MPGKSDGEVCDGEVVIRGSYPIYAIQAQYLGQGDSTAKLYTGEENTLARGKEPRIGMGAMIQSRFFDESSSRRLFDRLILGSTWIAELTYVDALSQRVSSTP